MARKGRGRNRRLNNRANRAERRADSIRKKIQQIRKSGGDRSQIAALRKQKNDAINKARGYRQTIISRGGTVRDTYKSGGALDQRGSYDYKGGSNNNNSSGGRNNNKTVGEEAKENMKQDTVFPLATKDAPGVSVLSPQKQLDENGKPINPKGANNNTTPKGNSTQLQNNQGNTGIASTKPTKSIAESGFDPTKYGQAGFGMADYKELQKQGYDDKQIKAYAKDAAKTMNVGQGLRSQLGMGKGAHNFVNADGSIKYGKGMIESDPDKWEGTIKQNATAGMFNHNNVYKYGNKFNKKDIRIMTEAGMGINEIKEYMEKNNIENKPYFDTMFSRINKGTGFDESGENFDYGYRFDQRDIDKMFDAGKDQQYISDFISNNADLDDNKWANKWMDRYGNYDAEEPLEEIENPNDELLEKINSLEEQIKGLSNQGAPEIPTTTMPTGVPTGGAPVFSPWATQGANTYNPMDLYYQMSSTTPGSAAGTTPQGGTSLTETVAQPQQPTGGTQTPQPIQRPA